MIIQSDFDRQELENFKSYAGVREIGPFHKCFSAVVGPNGSGKSNVIDAMLFVFGKRAKKLRLNKVSELIHKSDAVKESPPTSARVSVFFQDIIDTGDGDNDFEIVPGSETVVSRIAKSDNSSSYKLNGKNCQFKDVATYLENKGVDLDNNRFLILQGEVEMISMMSPKGKTEDDVGLLEYLEEIIGSNQFVVETNASAELVETLTESRQEKLNRVKAVEKEKESLQSAKDEAEALLSKEHEIRKKRNVLYQIHSTKVESEIQTLITQKTDLVAKLDEERMKCSFTQATVDELHERLRTQQKKHDKNYNELVQTREEFASYERRDIKLVEEIRHLKTQQKKLNEKIREETKKRTDCVNKGTAAEESIPRLQQRIDDLLSEKESNDCKLEQLHKKARAETQVVRAELEVKSQELAPVLQEKAGIQASIETVQTKIQLLQDSTNRAKESLQKAENELNNLDLSKQRKIEEKESTEVGIQECKCRMLELENTDVELSSREAKLLAKQKILIEQAENAKTIAQAEGGTKNQAVHKILKASQGDGPLSKVGVLGRLGDLATVSPQYDVAVSTACGMLDHVVVQTTAGVQRCLDFLRKHNLGRANFIPLDKMKKGAHDSQVQTPEGAPRLFDLISPTTYSITPALFLAVGNTLVAPDLEVASRWAYEYNKRWRVVTLDGKLIETAGTMTGGGTSARKGGMRLTVSTSKPFSSGNT
jgi:structural maintenance of chromosome 4